MERFNLRSFLLLLLAACFITSAFIPDFWIMVNYNLVFFVAFFETIIQSQKALRLQILIQEKKNWQIALRFQIRQDALREAS